MHGVPNAWDDTESGLVSALEHDAQKESLEKCRAMIEAGYLNPDSFSTQFQNYQIWLANGTTCFTFPHSSAISAEWPTFAPTSKMFSACDAHA